MWLLNHEIFHFLISSLVAIFAYYRYRNFRAVLLAYLVGMFADIDHLFDYFIYEGISLLKIQQFLNAEYFCSSGHLYLFFHAWEWLILLLFLSRYRIFRPWVYVVFLALAGHLLLDQISNNMAANGYFILIRALNGFNINQVSYGCLIK